MMNDPCDQHTFFQGLDPEQQELLRPLFSYCEFTAGDVLFQQGELAAYLYLLVDGDVVLRHKPDDGPEIIIAHVRSNGVIGWSAALGNPTYTSSAVCTTPCQSLRVSAASLRNLYDKNPQTGAVVLEKLVELIAQRLSRTYLPMKALLQHGMGTNSS